MLLGSGSDSVGRAVTSDTRDLQFKSSYWHTIIEHQFTVSCFEKTKIKKLTGREWPIEKNGLYLGTIFYILGVCVSVAENQIQCDHIWQIAKGPLSIWRNLEHTQCDQMANIIYSKFDHLHQCQFSKHHNKLPKQVPKFAKYKIQPSTNSQILQKFCQNV